MTHTRIALRAGLALLATVAAASTAGCGSQDITRGRVEGALTPTFVNLYQQRAAILGETNVTAASTAASTTCDRGGPKIADVGPGSDWICMITFRDDHGQPQTGKFELQVHADSTYVAGGPSKLIGLAMLTNKEGKDVPNPVFEFDGAIPATR